MMNAIKDDSPMTKVMWWLIGLVVVVGMAAIRLYPAWEKASRAVDQAERANEVIQKAKEKLERAVPPGRASKSADRASSNVHRHQPNVKPPTVRRPRLNANPILDAYDQTGGHRFVHFTSDGPYMALRQYGDDRNDDDDDFELAVCCLKPGKTVVGQTLEQSHNISFTEFIFSCDGRKGIALGCTPPDTPGTAMCWDLQTGKRALPELHARVRVGAFSPDSRWLAIAGGGSVNADFSDDVTQVWDVSNGRKMWSPLRQGLDVRHVSFSPDGRQVATASERGIARVWDAATGKVLTPPLNHRTAVKYAVFNPDGTRLVTTSGDTAQVWIVATGLPLSPPLKHGNTVCQAAFSPDGKHVVTASGDGTAQVWDARTGKAVTPSLVVNQRGSGCLGARFSPNSKRVLTWGDHRIRVWDASTGAALTPEFGPEGGFVGPVAFSPDGQLVVALGSAWHAETGTSW